MKILIAFVAFGFGMGAGMAIDTARVTRAQAARDAAQIRADRADALELKTAQSLAEARSEASEALEKETEAESKQDELQQELSTEESSNNGTPVTFTPVTNLFSNSSSSPIQAVPIQNFCRNSAKPEWCVQFAEVLIAQLGQSQKPSDQIALKILQSVLR